mgnify:FL=1
MLVLDITNLSRAEDIDGQAAQLGAFYAERVKAEVTGLRHVGKSLNGPVVTGPAGLAQVSVRALWHGDVASGRYKGAGAAVILRKYPSEGNRGRRFAVVSILLCLRY